MKYLYSIIFLSCCFCTAFAQKEFKVSGKGNIDVAFTYNDPSSYFSFPKEKCLPMQVVNHNFSQEFREENGINNLSSAAVRLRAWTVMGDLMMTPIFTYSLNKEYLKGEKEIVGFNIISKYKDLVKRYNAVRPISFSAVVGMGLNPEDKMQFGAYAFFNIKSNDVIISAQEKMPYAAPTSYTWGEMMIMVEGDYAERYSFRIPAAFSPSDEGKDKLAKAISKTERIATFSWAKIDNVQVRARYPTTGNIYIQIKWPLLEIDKIYELYKKYESGEEKPPSEEIDEEVKNKNLSTYNKDDEWSQAVQAPVSITLDKDFNNTVTEEGVIKISGNVTGPKSLIKEGKIIAEGYEQTFSIDESGNFTAQLVLKSGINNIKVTVQQKELPQKITLSREPVDLRATLTWNTSGSDIDLYITDPDGFVCNYQNKTTSNMQLDVDNTRAFGPENIYVTKVKKGNYNIAVENYSNAVGTEATVYVFVNEQLKKVHKVIFTSARQRINIGTYSF